MPRGAGEQRDLGGGRLGVRIMALAVVLLVFLSAFGAWSLQSNLRTGRAEARAGVLRNTRVGSALASSVAATALSELRVMATLPAFIDGDVEGIRAYLRSIQPALFGFTAGLFWVDRDGVSRANSSEPFDGGIDVSDRPYFQESIGGTAYVSAGIRGKSSGAYLLVFSVPSKDAAGQPNGVIGGSVDLGSINADILEVLFGTSAISIYDREDKVIFGSNPDRLGSEMPPDFRAAARVRDEGVRPRGSEGPSGRPDQVVAYSEVENAGWTVVLEADEEEVFAAAEEQYERSLVILVALGAVAFVVAAFGAWRLDAAHRRVLEARARLTAMIERLPAGVVLVDAADRVSMANRAAIDALGAMSNGGGAGIGASAPRELVRSIESMASSGADQPEADIHVERDGVQRSFSVRSTPVRTRRGVAGAVALIDETTERIAEERRRSAMADLVAALAVSESTPQIARTVSSRALAAVDCDRCALVMLDPDSGSATITTDGIDGEWAAVLAASLDDPTSALARAVTENRAIDVVGAGQPGVERLVALPLQSAGRVVGVLVVGYATAEQGLDVAVLTGFGAQVGLSVDRARRRQIEHDVSLSLQRTLLTAPAADSARLTVAPRYRPSSDQMLVGGDFFDVINVSEDVALLVIGDVVGHGLEAATTMAQLKIAIRAFAFESDSPAEILGKLDDFVSSQLESARYTTAILMRVDSRAGTVRYAVAGHPPPLVCGPDRVVGRMATSGEPLLGLPPRGGRTELQVDLEPGQTAFCLYTDGLIERPDLALDEGIGQLQATISDGDPFELDLTADRIMEIVDGLPRRDDVAILYAVVRTDGP